MSHAATSGSSCSSSARSLRSSGDHNIKSDILVHHQYSRARHCHPRLDARGVRFGALSHVDHQNTAASPEPVPTSSTLHHRRSSPVQMDTTRTIMRGTVYHPQRGGNVTHRRSPVAYTQSPFQEAQMVFEFRKTHG